MGILIGLLHHFGVGVTGDHLAQWGEGNQHRGKHDEHNNGDADGDKKIDARQLEREFLFEGVGIHHHKAMFMFDDIAYRVVFQFCHPIFQSHRQANYK